MPLEAGPTRTCVRCGNELPGEAPLSLCSRCALAEAAAQAEHTADAEPLFFDDLALGQADALSHTAPGQMIGRYKLLEKLGEGGCGVVYVAEQQQPIRRRIALKLIKLGMDT